MVEKSAGTTEAGSSSQPVVVRPNPLSFAERDFSETRMGRSFLMNIAADQKVIWTSPRHLHWADGSWLFLMAGATAGSFATDRSVVRALPSDRNELSRYRRFSNDGAAALVGAGGALYLWSKISRDGRQQETGILAGEAVIDSLAVTTVLKYSLERERPDQGQARGTFFRTGNSFPSDHAAAAWSAANIIAHEYPGFMTKFLAYGLAAAVSASSAAGKEHFPSDVVVGSGIGWLIGRQVYRAHHNPDLGGTVAGDIDRKEDSERQRDRHDMGSPFVPLDSWVYPAFERLAAMGYVHTAIMGLKPWTRMECARLTDEAGENLETNDSSNREMGRLEAQLRQEFSYEIGLLGGGSNFSTNLESLYARAVSISGPVLTDSYHFGQTISYDFGRPFERGTNGQLGGSFRATAGPLALYVRAEYQHAPAVPGRSADVRKVIAERDSVPPSLVASGPLTAINRPQLLDAYVTVNLSNWQIAVGSQSLSWAPGANDSLLWSDNIEPVEMVRLVNPEPLHLTGILQHLGPVRIDQFFGRLRGHPYVPRPFVYGQKVNVKPFPFLELGFGRTVTIGGQGGDPLTSSNMLHSLFGFVKPSLGSVPGDSHSEMDWTFYIPKLRNYVVLYGDSYADDDILPIENPARNPWHPGIYITRFPGMPKIDFHMQGVWTDAPAGSSGSHGQLNYWNWPYRDGYTNNGNLIGNTVGREGRAIECWFRYWISPDKTVQFTYKHNTVDPDFIPGGGAWQDYALSNETHLRSGFYVKGEFQYEHISHYPLLFHEPQNNSTAILEIGFSPERKK